MALGTITRNANVDGSSPFFLHDVSFLADDDYAAGGTLFKATFQAAVGANVTPIAVIGIETGGYNVFYDMANDKLVMYRTGAAADSADAEVPDGDMSAVTLRLLVLSK